LAGPVLDDLRKEILALEGVSGLALDVTSKPPGTIEWE
jgi:GMP synthase PP-ATPase subunit